MTDEQYSKNLGIPTGKCDVILDTDTFNEVDDQFALSYLLRASEKLTVRAVCAAPFFNHHSVSPADGMEKSYAEILKLLRLANRTDLNDVVYRGADRYLPDESTPVESDAARAIVALSRDYSADKPLYIVAIAAITNVASALLLDKTLAERCVIVWLGGNAHHSEGHGAGEFNMKQDIAAARVLFNSGAPIVQLPCTDVVDGFRVSGPELKAFLGGKNPLCDYLIQTVFDEVALYCPSPVWSRVIWDVTAVGWLLNDGGKLMASKTVPAPIPQYDKYYSFDDSRPLIRYITRIHRDALLRDLVDKLTR